METSKSSLKDLENEAKQLIESGQGFNYVSRGLGTYIMFKKSEDDLMKFAYVCSECKQTESGEKEFSKPYTLNCSSCSHVIFKQEKVKGKGVKKKR